MSNMTFRKIFYLVCCVLLVSLAANVYWFLQRPDPDLPIIRYPHLFPGFIQNLDHSPDLQQELFNSFLFVTKNNGQSRVEYPFNLLVVNRNGCAGFSEMPLGKSQQVDLAAYVNKPVIVREFETSASSGVFIIKRLDIDSFVYDRLAEYKQACPFPLKNVQLSDIE